MPIRVLGRSFVEGSYRHGAFLQKEWISTVLSVWWSCGLSSAKSTFHREPWHPSVITVIAGKAKSVIGDRYNELEF